MAEALMQKMLDERAIYEIEIKSAGTHARDGIRPLRKVLEVCEQRGIDISSHSSLALTEELLKDSDIVLVMEKEQVQSVIEKFPEAKEKVKMLSSYSKEYKDQDIIDPVGGSMLGFRTTFAILDECVIGLLDDVLMTR
jgi:protein-tyrosine phosphatase